MLRVCMGGFFFLSFCSLWCGTYGCNSSDKQLPGLQSRVINGSFFFFWSLRRVLTQDVAYY